MRTRTFEESLARVLDPEGLYWRYPGDETDDQERLRVIEQRLDVPVAKVEVARLMMERNGWQLSEAPDGIGDAFHRLYFRKVTALTAEAKRNFLTAALRVAHDAEGSLMSWINVEDYEDNNAQTH